MKLDQLRNSLRPQPRDLVRPCTICNWSEATRGRPAKYVATKGDRTQWFDCGEHPDEPNGKVARFDDLEEWLNAIFDSEEAQPRLEAPPPEVFVEERGLKEVRSRLADVLADNTLEFSLHDADDDEVVYGGYRRVKSKLTSDAVRGLYNAEPLMFPIATSAASFPVCKLIAWSAEGKKAFEVDLAEMIINTSERPLFEAGSITVTIT